MIGEREFRLHGVIYLSGCLGRGSDLLNKSLGVSACFKEGRWGLKIGFGFGGSRPGSETHVQLCGDCANHALNLLAVLECDEGGHRLDGDGLGNLGLLLDVNLDKLDVGELGLELVEVRADQLAWAAPCRPEVDDNDVTRVDLCVSLGSAPRHLIM